jgi:hypothetical protein
MLVAAVVAEEADLLAAQNLCSEAVEVLEDLVCSCLKGRRGRMDSLAGRKRGSRRWMFCRVETAVCLLAWVAGLEAGQLLPRRGLSEEAVKLKRFFVPEATPVGASTWLQITGRLSRSG